MEGTMKLINEKLIYNSILVDFEKVAWFDYWDTGEVSISKNEEPGVVRRTREENDIRAQ
jgi:hypothetical protein